jgi:hypothetical protein
MSLKTATDHPDSKGKFERPQDYFLHRGGLRRRPDGRSRISMPS